MIKRFETENKCIKLLSIMMCVLMLFMITCSFMVQSAHANELIAVGGVAAVAGIAAVLCSLGIISQNTQYVTDNIISPLQSAMKSAGLLSPVGLLPYYTISGVTYIGSNIVNFVRNWLYSHGFYSFATTDTYYNTISVKYSNDKFVSLSVFLQDIVSMGLNSQVSRVAAVASAIDLSGCNFAALRYGTSNNIPWAYIDVYPGIISAKLGSAYSYTVYFSGSSITFYRFYADQTLSNASYSSVTNTSSTGSVSITGGTVVYNVGEQAQDDVNYAQVPSDKGDAQDTITGWSEHELTPTSDAKITLPDNTVIDAVDENDDAITDTLLPQTFADTVPDAITIPQQVAITGSTTTDVNTEVENTDVDVSSLSQDTTLLGLMETRFPWCIPWDLTASIRALSADAQAPCFTVDLFKDVTWDGLDLSNTSFTISFDRFSQIAAACRWMMTIIFCGNLALITKKMIWS